MAEGPTGELPDFGPLKSWSAADAQEKWCLKHHMRVEPRTLCPDADRREIEAPCEAIDCPERMPVCYGAPPATCQDHACPAKGSCWSECEEDRPECYGDPTKAEPDACEACAIAPACVEVQSLAATQEMDDPPAPEMPAKHDPFEASRPPAFGVINKNTGEALQMSLEGATWAQYRIKTSHLSLSAGGAVTDTDLDGILWGGELRTGAIVEVTLRARVQMHAPVHKKGAYQGKIVLAGEVPTSIEVIRYADGPVEPAENVDGIPKALEEGTRPAAGETIEAPADTESPDGEALHDCSDCKHTDVDWDQEPCAQCKWMDPNGEDPDCLHGTEDNWERSCFGDPSEDKASECDACPSLHACMDLVREQEGLVDQVPDDKTETTAETDPAAERPECFGAYGTCLAWTQADCPSAAACLAASPGDDR
jgi:hypothetical protein